MQCPSLRVLFIALALVGWPLVASAQSQFTGIVTDESGAAMPGVTVEASSPALIEKVKTAVTDGSGRYTIVDLRPGTYKLTFTLTGFATVIRDELQMTSNFTATINAELKVGSLEESITVSGDTPIVDTQQVSRTTTLGRDLLDGLPTTRSISSIGIVIPGIRLSTPDVGGERVLEASANRSRGLGDNAQTMLIDGMSMTASSGGQMPYTNDQMDAELSVRAAPVHRRDRAVRRAKVEAPEPAARRAPVGRAPAVRPVPVDRREPAVQRERAARREPEARLAPVDPRAALPAKAAPAALAVQRAVLVAPVDRRAALPAKAERAAPVARPARTAARRSTGEG